MVQAWYATVDALALPISYVDAILGCSFKPDKNVSQHSNLRNLYQLNLSQSSGKVGLGSDPESIFCIVLEAKIELSQSEQKELCQLFDLTSISEPISIDWDIKDKKNCRILFPFKYLHKVLNYG